jgi:exodeoxyribonuclease V
MNFQLNQDQKNLIISLNKFLESDEKTFVLSGQAGVGKTTCINHFLNTIDLEEVRVAITTPTNKALKVIRESIDTRNVTFKTIYSLLGLRLEPNGSVKELIDAGGEKDAGQYDLIVIDEGSMLSKVVLEHLEQKTIFTGTKILIIGDKEQLPPVGEDVSIIWKAFKTSFELTKVERHNNSILGFVQNIRSNNEPEFVSTGDQVFIHTDSSFEDILVKTAREGKFHNGTAKAIAWRNVTVDMLNDIIRQEYESTKSKKPFVRTDRIVVMAPIPSDISGAPSLASTDDEGIVVAVATDRHPKYPQFKIFSIDLKMEDGDLIVARVIHPDSEADLKEYLDELAKKKSWKLFWACKDSFHQIKHGYAITSHRSQGSTFKEVFVDAGDVMLNRDVDTRTKCLYVACSRASKELHIFP